MPLFALALSGILGAGLEIFGAMGEADRQQQQAEFSAQQDELNAQLARTQAADAIYRGGEKASEIGQQGRALAGSQKVAFASSGVDLSGGSPADVVGDTAAGTARDQVVAHNNAFREAFGYNFEADQYTQRAKMSRQAGRNMAGSTMVTGGLRAARQILSTSSLDYSGA